MNSYYVGPRHWKDIPGWFDWLGGTYQAVFHFPNGSRFCEVGLYLGQSVCALAVEAKTAGKQFNIVGVDTCRGTGVENGYDHHSSAVDRGQGSFVGELYRNIIATEAVESVSLLVTDSVTAASLFPDEWFDWVNIDAAHDYDNVKRDIQAWVPKVKKGGWLTGDDYCTVWPGVIQAVNELLPTATPWAHDSWRYCK